MKTSYYLTDDDAGKIAIIAEKLYQKRHEIGDTVIGWEDFTIKYMKFSVPDIEDEISIIKWVNARSTWPGFLNKELCEHKYPMQLYVSPNTGIYVRILKEVVNETSRKGIKKAINALRKAVDRLEDLKKSKAYPNSIRTLDSIITVLNGTMNELSLGLGKTPGITGHLRKELKKIVDIKLPNKIKELELQLNQ